MVQRDGTKSGKNYGPSYHGNGDAKRTKHEVQTEECTQMRSGKEEERIAGDDSV